MRILRGTGLVVSAVAAAVTLVGCGEDSPPAPSLADSSAEEILGKAQQAARDATSFRMKGNITTEGTSLSLDIRFQKDKGVTGTISSEGVTFEVLVVDDKAYLKGDQATWASFAGDGPAQLLAGKYILVPESAEGFSDLLAFADASSFLDKGLEPEGTVTKTEVKEINGVSAIGLIDQDAEGEGTLYVAAEEPAYPLRIEGPAGEGAVDFSEWNEPVELAAPPADQVVDLKDLGVE